MQRLQHEPLLDSWRGWALPVLSFPRGEEVDRGGAASWGGTALASTARPQDDEVVTSAAPRCEGARNKLCTWPPRALAAASALEPPATPRCCSGQRERGSDSRGRDLKKGVWGASGGGALPTGKGARSGVGGLKRRAGAEGSSVQGRRAGRVRGSWQGADEGEGRAGG